MMGSSDTPGPLQPLQDNLELLASLIHLARQGNPEQQRRYMEWAAKVVEEMRTTQSWANSSD
jgi:hypothetical protein